jgi:hypothetical protein
MSETGFMPKPNGKVVATLLTDHADLEFVKIQTEAEGRTVSNWLRREIQKLRRVWEAEKKKREAEKKRKPRQEKKNPDEN